MSSDFSESEEENAAFARKRYHQKYCNPVYKQLAHINGEINRLNTDELQQKLTSLKLDPRGSGSVVKKRLKNYYRNNQMKRFLQRGTNCAYEFLVVIDFEATCSAENHFEYQHEIIEFPALLIKTADQQVVDEFHEYCRPVLNRKLTQFCKELTGITQEIVDSAQLFPDVLQKFEAWLEKHQLGTRCTYRVITDGSFDMGRFLVLQCQISKLKFPAFGQRWVNLKKSYSNFYGTKLYKLQTMLELLGLTFEGQQHCGLDDSRNIARIVRYMLRDGAKLWENERVALGVGHGSRSRLKNFIQITQKEASEKIRAERRKIVAGLSSVPGDKENCGEGETSGAPPHDTSCQGTGGQCLNEEDQSDYHTCNSDIAV